MLVLSRKKGEGIVIGDNIEIEILDVFSDRVRIGVKAPNDVRICRQELMNQTVDINKLAVSVSLKNYNFKNKHIENERK